MPQLPGVVVFDVNETLSDMAPLAGRFEQVGAPAHLRATWFASVLRDGFGLSAAGARGGSRYPAHLLAPELTATSITDLARQLTS